MRVQVIELSGTLTWWTGALVQTKYTRDNRATPMWKSSGIELIIACFIPPTTRGSIPAGHTSTNVDFPALFGPIIASSISRLQNKLQKAHAVVFILI